MSGWRCANCGTSDTPIKRKGPKGPGTLCNACGVRLMRGRQGKSLPRAPRRPDAQPRVSSGASRPRAPREPKVERPRQSAIFQVIPAPDQPTLVAPSTNVKAIFSDPMDRPSTEAAFSLRRIGPSTKVEKPVKGTFKWGDDSKSFVFAPEKDLRGFTLYMLELTTHACYADGRRTQMVEKASFRTSEDDICYQCNVVNEEDLIMCDVSGCPRVYHRGCLRVEDDAPQIICPAPHECAHCGEPVSASVSRLCQAESCGRLRHVHCPRCPAHPSLDPDEDDVSADGAARKRKRSPAAGGEEPEPTAKRERTGEQTADVFGGDEGDGEAEDMDDSVGAPSLGDKVQAFVTKHDDEQHELSQLAAQLTESSDENEAVVKDFDAKLRARVEHVRGEEGSEVASLDAVLAEWQAFMTARTEV